MNDRGRHTWREITTQGESWRDAIEETLARRSQLLKVVCPRRSRAAPKGESREIIFVGCGSTHYLAQFAAPFFQSVTGIPCRGLPSSELALQSDSIVSPGTTPLIVALSRSGETSETVMAIERMRERGCSALAISCYADTPLSRACSLTIPIPEGQEQSLAQTRSFAGMLVAVQTLAALVADDDALIAELRTLPDLASDIVARAGPLAQRTGTDERYKRITFLGSGPLLGLASEATVKMKEMSLSIAEPYHFMEFRHGPMSLLDDEHLVVALLSDRIRTYELAVLRDDGLLHRVSPVTLS